MSGVFLSYSRGDHALAEQIIDGLRAVGVEVWWDQDMRGVDWQDELARQIGRLVAVMVLWSDNSATSKNVRDEARLGLDTDKLINVMHGVAMPPFPYDRVNGLPLDGWNGRDPHRGWTRLVETIEEKLIAAGSAVRGEVTSVLIRREADQRRGQAVLAQARAAFQQSQLDQIETDEALKAAIVIADRAEEQLQRVIEMRASPTLRHAAQAEVDDANAAREAADQANRSAKAAMSEASRGVSRAEQALEALYASVAEPTIRPAAPENPKPAPPPVRPTPPPAPEPVAEPVVEVEPAVIAPTPPAPEPEPIPLAVVTEPAPAITPRPQADPPALEPAAIEFQPTPPPLLDQVAPSRPPGARGLIELLFGFNGRIARQRFWLAQVGAFVGLFIIFSTCAGLGSAGAVLFLLAFVAFVWICLALGAKRSHDSDRSGWYAVIYLVPIIGWAWGLYELGLRVGTPGANRFGPPLVPAPAPAPTTT